MAELQDNTTRLLLRASKAEGELARSRHYCAKLQADLDAATQGRGEAEIRLTQLQSKCYDLLEEKAALESRYSHPYVSQVTLEQVLVEYAQQQDEIERLQGEKLCRERQVRAAISLLQKWFDVSKKNDGVSSEVTTIHDVKSTCDGDCDA